jgi:hypothetical protein
VLHPLWPFPHNFSLLKPPPHNICQCQEGPSLQDEVSKTEADDIDGSHLPAAYDSAVEDEMLDIDKLPRLEDIDNWQDPIPSLSLPQQSTQAQLR